MGLIANRLGSACGVRAHALYILTEEMRLLAVRVHLLVLVRDTALLKRDPSPLNVRAELQCQMSMRNVGLDARKEIAHLPILRGI